MPFETIQLDLSGEVATLTFNRPEKRNALSPTMIDEIVSALGQLESNASRVLVLTGAGESFCSGMDIGALQSLTGQSVNESLEDSRHVAGLFRRLYNFPKPVISVVRGAAVAGGCGLATLADFTLAEPKATFGYPEGRIGFIPALVSVFLVRQIGEKRALSLLLSGRLIGAEEALALGLVSEIVPSEQLLDRATKLASQLLAVSPARAVFTKQLLHNFSAADLDRQIELAIEANARIRSTRDFREDLSAYLEKRKPHWGADE